MSLVLSTEFEAGLEAKATAKGLSVEDYLKQLVERDEDSSPAKPTTQPNTEDLPLDEWRRQFRAMNARNAAAAPTGLEAAAAAEGIPIRDYVNRLFEQARQNYHFVPPSPEELMRSLDEIAERHRALGLPTLSDEAISREFIYAECGL